ncbi:MAG: metabolite traffic protein EboE [Aureliella sp.]
MLNHPSFGYCTNVHAGVDLDSAKANLLEHSAEVRRQLRWESSLPVGLWLAENAARTLAAEGAGEEFGSWLDEHLFLPYTLNGFPQGDFHQKVVKLDVYSPTWKEQRRRDYTVNLIDVLHAILPSGKAGSISTLPLGWPEPQWSNDDFVQAAENVRFVARYLHDLLDREGREIVVAIEPEPGCILNTAPEIVDFFEAHLFGHEDESAVRRHISVCHDVCHSGVMFEPQVQALERYRAAGIRIGKVQVSSAVHVPWDKVTEQKDRLSVLEQLKEFNEPKYMHQTTRSESREGRLVLSELASDLPDALTRWLPERPTGSDWPTSPWRVHFHVPIFVDTFGALKTTQNDITQVAQHLAAHRETMLDSYPWFLGHYEVETYAWPVLPPELSVERLADGIAKELDYFARLLSVN